MLGKNLIQAATGAGGAAGAALYIEDTFQTWLYTGNGSTQTITNGIDLAGERGLVWLKGRSSATGHQLYDTERGATQSLASSTTQPNETFISGLTSFNSDGFTIGNNGGVNGAAQTYASWTFRKAPGFFDVVTYTGTGSVQNIAHNLGSVPGTIIVKRTDTTGDWQVYHRSIANTEYLVLNSTAAKATGTTRWNSTTPTSSVFSLGTDATVNASGGTYVAYLFAHDEQIFGEGGDQSVIKCGSYTGNGSATGPTVTLDWEPQWLLIKRTDSSGDWNLIDNMRGFAVGGADAELNPNLSAAESSGTFITPLSTGFQLNTTDAGYNATGGTYIYIAIRRGPMKTPTSGTEVFGLSARSGTGADAIVAGGQVADLAIIKNRSANLTSLWATRLTSLGYLFSASTNSEGVAGSSIFQTNPNPWDIMDGVKVGTTSTLTNASGSTFINYLFRRAPGFLDIVTYTGTGIARTVAHNLGVAPELMIVKSRSAFAQWAVYSSALGIDYRLFLVSDAAISGSSTFWNATLPTSSVFSIGTHSTVNTSTTTYIAYLFATLPGISKVGSYTGTGTTLQIDCGFASGARFVLIKRTDSSGDWYVWDTARGIVSGNDPYLLLNSPAAEVTSTDYIDPYSAGFEISSTAPAAINASGGSFIYLAIA